MLKAIHVKISEEAFELLETIHRVSDIPKSRVVERAIRAAAKDYEDMPKAIKLLRAVEKAEQELADGRAHRWEDVKVEINAILKQKRSRKKMHG